MKAKLLVNVQTESLKKGDIVDVELMSGTKYRLVSNHNITGEVGVAFTLLDPSASAGLSAEALNALNKDKPLTGLDFVAQASALIANLPQKQRSDYEIFLKNYCGAKPLLVGKNSFKMKEYQAKVAEATKTWMASQNIPLPTETKSKTWIWLLVGGLTLAGLTFVYFKFIRK